MKWLALSVSILLFAAATARSEDATPLRIPAGRVVLEPDDTLEFTLRAKTSPLHAPSIGVWLLPSGAEKPGSAALPTARTFVVPSAQPGEWLVHARGLNAERGTWDLYVRWTAAPDDPDAKGLAGEARIPGAVTIKAEAADVVLLMDGSLSMGRTDPKRLRVEAAREFIEQARKSGSVGRIAVVQFDSKSRTLAPLTGVNENFEPVLEQIDERGETDIDGGIRHSLPLLSDAGSIVLLTDGKQEPGDYRNAHAEAKKAGIAIHSLALGRDADRDLLKRIASETGGTFSDAAKDRDLALAYAAIASRIARARTILSVPNTGAQPIEIPLDGASRSLVVSIHGEQSGTLSVKGPAGEAWNSPAQAGPSYFKDSPTSGAWSATWNGAASPLTAGARTKLYPQFFRANLDGDGAVVIDTDEPFLALSLAEGAAPLAAQSVEVSFSFKEGLSLRVQLRDDGSGGDVKAGDGIFSADLPPNAEPNSNGSYFEAASGELSVVVQGQRENLPYRRETRSNFLFKRHLGAALIASGPLDFGTKFCGERLSAEIALRVRGPGGALSVKQLPPESAEQKNGVDWMELIGAPAVLGPRQRATLQWSGALGEWQEPGLYGGILEFELAGSGRARVPWRVEVRQPKVQVPAALNVGTLSPGQPFELKFNARVDGGQATVDSIELDVPWRPRQLAWLSTAQPTFVVPGIDLIKDGAWNISRLLTTKETEIQLNAGVALDAPGGPISARIILRDAARRELATIPIQGKIESAWIKVLTPLQFGPIEAGDTASLPFLWKLVGSKNSAAFLPYTRIDLVPDRPLPRVDANITQPELDEQRDAFLSRLSLSVPENVRAGELGGWVRVEAPTALLQQRWSAFVVQPHLGVEPSALDFGTVAPGARKKVSAVLTTHAVKAVPLNAKLSRPLSKPNLAKVVLPADCVRVHLPPHDREMGAPAPMEVVLELPDGAQDGLYTGSIEVESRLGIIAMPLRLNVVSPVPVAPFHVSPASMILNFQSFDSPPPSERVRITSHKDEDQTLVLQMKAGSEKLCAYLLLDPQSGLETETMTLTLPARATLDVTLRAREDARAGERSRVVVSGETDQHGIEVLIERPQGAALPIADDPSRLLNWLLFLLVLLLMLLAYLIRNLIQRKWVRYALYSILFHAAFFPLVMPKQKLMEALPASMQITLLETEASLGMELSEQQMRRLDALQAGDEPPPSAPERAALDTPLPPPALTTALPNAKPADAPSKSELEKRLAEELRAEVAKPQSPARTVSHAIDERPLEAESLQPAAPAPKVEKAQDVAVAARTATSLAEQFTDAPLPVVTQATPARPERSESELVAAKPLEASPQKTEAVKTDAPVRTVVERSTAFDEAPLKIDPLPAQSTTKQPTQISENAATVRDAAAVISSTAPSSAALTAGASVAVAVPTQKAGSARASELAASTGSVQESSNGSATGKSAAASANDSGRARTSAVAGLGGDAPLDAGPLVGTVAKTGNAKGTAEATTGSGPTQARGTALNGIEKNNGTLGDVAAALGRSTAAGGKPGPRASGSVLDGRGGAEDLARMGDGARASSNSGSGGTGVRTSRDVGAGLDGAPLDAGGLAKIEGGKAGEGKVAKASDSPGRGAAVVVPTNPGGLPNGAKLPGGLSTLPEGIAAKPSERGGSVMKALPGYSQLDARPAGGPGGGKNAPNQKGERVMHAPYTGALLKVNLGLTKHAGDWNSSPTALYNLRTAFMERCGLPEVEFKVNTVDLSDLKGLLKNRTVLVTSNDAIPFKPEEIRAMREYMQAGGTIWINDSSASEDERFDKGFRPALEQILPGATLAPLPMEHPFFFSAYDLRKGFKGYRVPPGDKYRVNYIEAAMIGERAALIYTRNDYADGLEIDPRMSAGGKSLTDLTNAEMQEASLRFGINLLAYSMQGSAPKMPPPPEGVAEFEKVYRYSGPPLAALDEFKVLEDQWQKPIWIAEKEWCNPTEYKIEEDAAEKSKLLTVEFKGGTKFKAAVTRNLPADLSATKALVMDLHSSLGRGFNASLLFYNKDGKSYESRPIFIRPGWNRNVRFPLDMGDMKSSASNPPWKEYDQPFALRNSVERVTLLIYNLGDSGAVKVGPWREHK